MASMSIVFFLLFTSFIGGRAVPKQSSHIALGSSLSPITQPTSWLSPSQKFAFGFYRQGSGFAIGIWLVSGDNTTVVWTAIRDHPPFASNAMLVFTEDGKLLLRTERGQEKLIANATDSASHASMLNSGNFVLYDKDSKIIWQSFYFPTDTILGGQTLFAGYQLFSGLTENDHSTGRFHLKMQDDGNLVLYPVNTGDTPGDAYWNTETFGYGSKFHLYLNKSGSLFIVNGTTLNIVYGLNKDSSTASNQNNAIYRATLDFDGVFRLYSHVYDESGYKVSKLWKALDDPCHVKSFCGFNSFCTMNDDQPYCICLPGTDFVDVNRNSLGCERNFSEAGCRVGTKNASFYDITTMENLMWGDRPYVVSPMSIEECNRSCLEDCDCGAALFKSDSCMKQKLPLRYVRRDMKEGYTALLKVGMRSIKSDNPIMAKTPVIVITSKRAIVQIFLVSLSCTVLSCVALAVSGLFIFKSRVLWYKRLLENGNFGLNEEVTLRLFSYNELKRATNGFKEQLGKGSFGAVYKGALYKGKRLVAVKRLEKLVEEGEREFRAEMRAIGRTHHRNLVRLLGYCAEDSKRLLVYEYMSNGSLADHLFKAQTSPNWNERVRIAQDIARGILYLHEECETSIIHCDIKPQNILMDDFWTAKISDFGLAKFLMADQTRTFTGVRGTRGYLAPEWQKNTPISVKADVYSYGIVLLEIVCCRRNVELHVSNEEEVILSTWIYKCFVDRELHKILRGEEADKTMVENMVKVALWCIQDEPALRPTMKSVVLMLEGITEVSIPPCPATMSE
ncbi:G-type lectin S-receptor-like serine/threonine-protein kinase LECRK2 [Quercus robur]|uniref:G-type lectin S-receptor-like serine/threonine-protein kinase LECRK2 n=1 Tax=Quercus robur TaxID=38942 RepID=UPI002162B758|nr:G-type lectin S-receptor-like serine/threonine-protein kinase LECRK2 [Quercus robur]